jgi:hypothetical protein
VQFKQIFDVLDVHDDWNKLDSFVETSKTESKTKELVRKTSSSGTITGIGYFSGLYQSVTNFPLANKSFGNPKAN